MANTRKSRTLPLRSRVLAGSIAALFAITTLPSTAPAAAKIWDDGGPSFDFSDALNWNLDTVPVNGDSLQFDAHGVVIGGNEILNHNLGALSVTTISFIGPDQFTINASAASSFNITTGITNTSGVLQTINAPLTLPAVIAVNAISGNLTLGGTISGAGGMTVAGAATTTITGTNNYSGGTTISGTVAINNGQALGTGNVIVNNGGTLLGTANATFAGNDVTLNGGSTVAAAAGTVLQLDSGTTGSVTMTAGTITFGNAANTGVVAIGNSAGGSSVSATADIVVAFGTLRNAGGSPSPLSFFTTNGGNTTVDAGATLDTNGFTTRIANLLGAGTLTNDGAALGTFNMDAGNFSGVIKDGAGVTALAKGTAGTFIVTGANTYTGGTTITQGTLQIGNGGATGSILGNVVNNGTLSFNRDNLTFGGTISGTGSVLVNMTGTLVLTGTNSYSGGTTVSNGILSINNSQALGTGAVTVGNGATLLATSNVTFSGNDVTLSGGSTVAAAAGTVFALDSGTTGSVTMTAGNITFGNAANTGVVAIGNSAGGSSVSATANIIVAFGTLRNAGGSPSPLSFFTTNGGNTTVNTGATLDTFGNNTRIANLLGSGTLTNDGAGPGTFVIEAGNFTGQIKNGAGVTALTKIGTGTLTITGAANNTYTGPTNINEGTLLLDNITLGDAGIRSAVVNVGDGVGASGTAILRNGTIGGNIDNLSAITVNSDGLFDLNGLGETIGSLAGTAGGQLTLGATGNFFTGGNNASTTYAGTITGGATSTMQKQGTGTWIVTGANAGFLGQATVAGGTLWAQNPDALGGAAAGATTITGGGNLRTTGLLNVSSLNWGQGKLQLAPGAGTGDVFTVNTAGGFQNVGGQGGTYSLDTTGMTLGNAFVLTNYSGATNFTSGQFTALGLTDDTQLQGTFTLTPTQVIFTITGATSSGNVIQNAAPVGTPTFADFTVNGPVTTGGIRDNNTVQTLTFAQGGSLTIFNTLFVTQGPVNLPGGSFITLGQSGAPQGNLSASQLNLLAGSTLSGNGTIFGNLVNGGLVSPGYSPGTITVTQNYTQSSSGTLRIEVAGTRRGQYDLLEVGGVAYLDGRLEILGINGYRPHYGDKVKFLTARGGVVGEFSDVDQSFRTGTILEPTIVYNDHDVTLEIVRGSFEEVRHLTPNQRSTAQALDSVSADNPYDKALLYLDYRNLRDLPGDFDRIAPEELSSIFSISTSGVTVQNTNLQRRTDDIRSGANGFSAAGLAINGQTPSYSGGINFRTGAAGPTGSDNKESKEVKATVVEEEKRWGAFLSGTGEWVDVDGDGNARGFDLTSGGFTLGLDYKVTPNFALGILAGYTGTTADLTNDGRVWVNGGKAGLYSTYFTGGFYLDAAVTGGYNSYDTKRDALQGAARGSTEGGELNALAGIGYDWKVGALTIGPTATFSYTLVGMDSFTEHGSLAPLDIDRRNAESIRSAVGFRASYDWKCGGIVIKPEVRAAWQHEYGDKSYDISASFAGGDGDHFLVNGPEIGRDSLLLGAGFAIQFSESCSTYFYYDGELGRDRYDRNSVTGGVRVAF